MRLIDAGKSIVLPFVVLTMLACSSGTAVSLPVTLQEAENAYFNLDLRRAREAFTDVLRDGSAQDEDRAEAARRLSIIAWRFHRNPVEAKSLLEKARVLGMDEVTVYLESARFLLETRDYMSARETARRALAMAKLRSDAVRARILFSRSVVEEVMTLPPGEDLDEDALIELRVARDLMADLLDNEPGLLEASRILIFAALLLGDGEGVLTGWRSYYWILPGDQTVPALEGMERSLSRILSGWSGSSQDSENTAALVKALAQSGFHRIAGRFVMINQLSENSDLREIVAYGAFLERVERSVSEIYRGHSLGNGAGETARTEFMAAARQLWDELNIPENGTALSERRVIDELEKQFHNSLKFEEHDGVLCMHMGFLLIDTEYSVEQYGHHACIRLKVLDHMVTNGYNSWFWDGLASPGGWVDRDGSIVQVRPAYAEGPLRAWRSVWYPEDKRDREEEISSKSLNDDEIATANPHAYLPGLALRLRQRGYKRVLSELRADSLEGKQLQAAFIREVARRVHASSILAHEGRHAIDKRGTLSFLRSHAEKEYRAKLSEVSLAPDPGLAITGGILSPNIGGPSSHGRANERIVRHLVEWMGSHDKEIEGLDSGRPFLPQLDLLTDDQLRSALRENDPLLN